MRLQYPIPPLGGLKTDLPSHLLDRHFSPSLNGVWFMNGKIRRIPGKLRLVDDALDSSGGVMGLYHWVRDSGNAILFAVTQDRAYYYTGTVFTEIQPADGDFTGGSADLFDIVPSFDASGNEILVITNGVDPIRKWTGTGDIAVLAGSPTKAKYLEVYKNYLFAANMQGSPTDPRQLVYSDLGNAEIWPANNFVNLYGTPDAIVRPKILRDSLVIYKANSISVLDYIGGDLEFRLRENLINGLGLIGSRAVHIAPFGTEVHYFIGSDHEMYQFDLVERVPMGANISSVLSVLDPATWNSICSVKSDEYDKLIWALPGRGETGNFDLLVFDTKTGSWWVHEGEANRIYSMAESVRASDLTWDTIPEDAWDNWDYPEGWDSLGASGQNTSLILFGCADGRIRYWAAGVNDDGVEIDSHYTYSFDNLDNENSNLKLVTKIILEVANEGSGTLAVEVFVNNDDQAPVALDESGNTSKSVDLFSSDTNKTWITHEVDVAVQGYNFSVKLSSTGQVWSGRLLGMEYELLGRRVL
jgi:hypothetical protein